MQIIVFLYSNVVNFYQFKAKDPEIKPCPLCLRNISKGFAVDNMKKTGLNGKVYHFSVDFNTIATRYISDTVRLTLHS